MAPADSTEEDVFKDLPPDLPLGEAKTVWARRADVQNLIKDGKGATSIRAKIHCTQKAAEWLHAKLTEQSQPVEKGETGGSESPAEAATAAAAKEVLARAPAGEGVRNPPPPAQNPAAGGGGTPMSTRQEIPPERRQQMAAQLEALTLADVGAPAGRSPLAGQIEMPDMTNRLAEMCRLLGLTPEKAKGVAVAFAYQAKDARDLRKLREIAIGVGAPPGLADTIANTYRSMNTSIFESGSSSSLDEGTATLEDVERRLGIRPTATGTEGVVERLNREEQELRIQRARLELEKQKKDLGMTSGSSVGSSDDGMMDILINVNGIPMPKRIKESEYPRWQPFLAKPPGAERPADEVPAWAKALQDQNKALQDRLERQDRERDDERRRREEDERLDRRLAPIEKALTDRPGPSAESQELKALRDEMRLRDQRDTDSRFDRLERLYAQGRSPEEADKILDAESKRMSGRGWVPRGQITDLTQEKVELENERDLNKAKVGMQTDLGHAATDIIKERPVRGLAKDFGLDKVAPEIIRQRAGMVPENRGDLVEQPPEHMERAAAELEGIAAGTVPPGALGRRSGVEMR